MKLSELLFIALIYVLIEDDLVVSEYNKIMDNFETLTLFGSTATPRGRGLGPAKLSESRVPLVRKRAWVRGYLNAGGLVASWLASSN